jgi:hypothetical protein
VLKERAGLREAAGLRGPRAETGRKQGRKWRKGMVFNHFPDYLNLKTPKLL